MPGLPWSPPLNENDHLVYHGLEGPKFLYLSEWVMMAKHTVTRGQEAFLRLKELGSFDEKEIAERDHEVELAHAFLKGHAHLFPELDERGDCVVEGKFREGPINRTPPPCGTCGGNREIEGFRPGDAPRVDCPECVPSRGVSTD